MSVYCGMEDDPSSRGLKKILKYFRITLTIYVRWADIALVYSKVKLLVLVHQDQGMTLECEEG